MVNKPVATPFSYACTCGASSSGALPDAKLAMLRQKWVARHTGAGHSPATKAEAKRVRVAQAPKAAEVTTAVRMATGL